MLLTSSIADQENAWDSKTPYEVFMELSGFDAKILTQGIPL